MSYRSAPGERARARGLAVLICGLLASLFVGVAQLGSSASAVPAGVTSTTCPANDPYGCGSTTVPTQQFTPTIALQVQVGPRGATVGVNACSYNPADSGRNGTITFNGQVVANVALDADGCLSVVGGSAAGVVGGYEGELAAAFAAPGFPRTFTVPDLPLGTYQVCSVFPGYSSPCASFQIVAQASSTDTSRGGGGGNLARTGFSIAALLLSAVVLIALGRYLRARSSRVATR